jgi:hypothetical protein
VLYDGDRAGRPVEYGARDSADPTCPLPTAVGTGDNMQLGFDRCSGDGVARRTGKQQDVDVEPMSPTSATNRSTTRE